MPLVDQGDSGAMAVLGAMHVVRARGLSDSSALSGHVMALINVGSQLDMMGKKPVDLGWISSEEYEQLTRAEKSLFNAANVYQAVAYTIAPELELGLLPRKATVAWLAV